MLEYPHPHYREVTEITADELLGVLTPEPQFQIEIFIKLGGHPDNHRYAYLSYLTKELRERGVPVKSSRTKGLWLEPVAA